MTEPHQPVEMGMVDGAPPPSKPAAFAFTVPRLDLSKINAEVETDAPKAEAQPPIESPVKFTTSDFDPVCVDTGPDMSGLPARYRSRDPSPFAPPDTVNKRKKALLVYIGLVLLSTSFLCFLIWCSYAVGNAGKWGLAFLIMFLGVPVLFLPLASSLTVQGLLCPGLILIGMGATIALSVSLPVAITAHRMKIAYTISLVGYPNIVTANCWASPEPDKPDWSESEFIYWADPSWKVDQSRVTASYYTDGSTEHTFCTAPVVSSTPGLCTGYCAVATCYEKRSNKQPCSASAMAACGWNYPADVVLSRALKRRRWYREYSDDLEFDKYIEAAKLIPNSCATGYERKIISWATDADPVFFDTKYSELLKSLQGQLWGYAGLWLLTLLVASICFVVGFLRL